MITDNQIDNFEYHIDDCLSELDILLDGDVFFTKPDKGEFYLNLDVDNIYRLEYIIKEAKRKLGLM